ncbi:MAG: hypothetical protein ACKVP7_04275 [Hyphomicrobiaceae bacterium]
MNDLVAMLTFLSADGTDDVPQELADILSTLLDLELISYERGRWTLTNSGEDYLERQVQVYH